MLGERPIAQTEIRFRIYTRGLAQYIRIFLLPRR